MSANPSHFVRDNFTNIISKSRYSKMLVRKAQGQPINPADVYVEPGLTNISVSFTQSTSLVSQAMAPSVPVSKQAGKYASFDRNFMYRDEMQERVDVQKAAEGTFGVNWNNEFKCPVYAWRTPIGGQARANAENAVDLDTFASRMCAMKARLRREVLWFGTFYKTGVWSTNVLAAKSGSGGVDNVNLTWMDANAKPVAQIKKALDDQSALVGDDYRANKVVFSRDTWRIFCEHPNVLNRINAGQTPGGPAEATPNMVAGWLGVDEVIIAGMVQTTSNENAAGDSAATYARIATSGCLLAAYVPKGPALYEPAAMYSFDWIPQNSNVGGYGIAVASWYEQDRKAQIYEIEMATSQKLVSADCGLFMSNLLTSAT